MTSYRIRCVQPEITNSVHLLSSNVFLLCWCVHDPCNRPSVHLTSDLFLSFVLMCTAGEEPAGLKGYFGMTVVVKETASGPGLAPGLGQETKAGTGTEQGSALESVRVLDATDWGHILTLWSHSTHVHLVLPRLPLSLSTLTKTPVSFGATTSVRVASATKAYTR